MLLSERPKNFEEVNEVLKTVEHLRGSPEEHCQKYTVRVLKALNRPESALQVVTRERNEGHVTPLDLSVMDLDLDRRHKDKERKREKRERHEDADGKRKRKKRKEMETTVRVVDDDADEWVEKNIDLDGDKVRPSSFNRFSLMHIT